MRMMADRVCLPRCFEPTFRTCEEPYEDEVSLCCFEIGFPNDYTTDDDPPVTLDCSHGVYSCTPGTTDIYGPVTNYTGVVGVSHVVFHSLETMINLGCDDADALGENRFGWREIENECWRFVYSDAVACSVENARDYWTVVLLVPPELHPEFTPNFVVQWECVGNGVIRIRAGITVGPVLQYDEGSPCAYSYTNSDMRFFCPIFEGFFSPDWWRSNVLGAGVYGPVLLPCIDFGDPGDSLEFGISNDCTWVPCGDPLDCFASCISGTVDCDGTTPAHVPVIYFTLSILGCCLSGTHPLTWSSAAQKYSGSVTCTSLGVTYSVTIEVSCNAESGDGDPSGPGGLVYIHLHFSNSDDDERDYGAAFYMSCTDGVLAETTGTIEVDTYCGVTGEGGWAIHG